MRIKRGFNKSPNLKEDVGCCQADASGKSDIKVERKHFPRSIADYLDAVLRRGSFQKSDDSRSVGRTRQNSHGQSDHGLDDPTAEFLQMIEKRHGSQERDCERQRSPDRTL